MAGTVLINLLLSSLKLTFSLSFALFLETGLLCAVALANLELPLRQGWP